MGRKALYVLIALGAIVAYVLYQNFYNVDPVEAWARQAAGTWVISDEDGSAELTLDADGYAHFHTPSVDDQPAIDAQGEWRIGFATSEIAILKLTYQTGLESWIEEINSKRSEDESPFELDKVYIYLSRDERGEVNPVMFGAESSSIGWTPFRDSSWEPTADWNELLVGYWNFHYYDSPHVSSLDAATFQIPAKQTPPTWNSEIRADGTWNWRMDPDIGTWEVLHDLGQYAVVEFVETGDEARRILTFQKLQPNGAISTIMYSGYESDDTMSDYYSFERKD